LAKLVPAADAHCHLNPVKGLGGKLVARKFKEKGGWFLAVVYLPPWHYGLKATSIKDYVKAYELVASEKKAVEKAGVKCKVLVGFHPAEPVKLAEMGWSSGDISKLIDALFVHVERMLKEGLADGIGEVGRPHFQAKPEHVLLAEKAMARAMELAKDYGVPVHLHLENLGELTVSTVAPLARAAGIAKKVVVHHAYGKTLKAAIAAGLGATAPVRKGVLEALKNAPAYAFESDFLDDPKRPGVVAYPWEVASVVNELVDSEVASAEYMYKVNVDVVCDLFDVEY